MELQAARDSTGLTQKQVADKTGVTELAYQRYELGMRKPSAETAISIANALGIKSFDRFKKLFGATITDNTNPPDGNQANG